MRREVSVIRNSAHHGRASGSHPRPLGSDVAKESPASIGTFANYAYGGGGEWIMRWGAAESLTVRAERPAGVQPGEQSPSEDTDAPCRPRVQVDWARLGSWRDSYA